MKLLCSTCRERESQQGQRKCAPCKAAYMKAYMREQRARGATPAACTRSPRPISAQPVGTLFDEGCFRRSAVVDN